MSQVNLNDGSVEGLRHASKPIETVQYHPEGAPGPLDALAVFDRFLDACGHGMNVRSPGDVPRRCHHSRGDSRAANSRRPFEPVSEWANSVAIRRVPGGTWIAFASGMPDKRWPGSP